MAGIIMAGRTGAAFAAQLGTMQVNEEIDALKTLGISPMEFLVLPRMLALVLMMPLLCIYADLMGILGGLIVGVFMLEPFLDWTLSRRRIWSTGGPGRVSQGVAVRTQRLGSGRCRNIGRGDGNRQHHCGHRNHNYYLQCAGNIGAR
jgi:hypothetical protein